MENYYAHYKGDRNDIIPSFDEIVQGFTNRPDRFVIIYDNEEYKNIICCAVFLTLSDDTFLNLEHIDISRVDVLTELIKESGPNIHFVLLATKGLKPIRTGIRLIKERLHPKTISWWSPDLTKLHKYNLN
jgi:hypothetical protein